MTPTTSHKYGSAEAEALAEALGEGWYDGQTGTVEAPGGAVSLIHIDDVATTALTFDAALARELVGSWIIVEDSDGFVDASRYSHDEAVRLFNEAEDGYAAWCDSDENEDVAPELF